LATARVKISIESKLRLILIVLVANPELQVEFQKEGILMDSVKTWMSMLLIFHMVGLR
jgi:hypothetical protein